MIKSKITFKRIFENIGKGLFARNPSRQMILNLSNNQCKMQLQQIFMSLEDIRCLVLLQEKDDN